MDTYPVEFMDKVDELACRAAGKAQTALWTKPYRD